MSPKEDWIVAKSHNPGAAKVVDNAGMILLDWKPLPQSSCKRARSQTTWLLPANTHHLLCNWSPVAAVKIDALISVLGEEVWKEASVGKSPVGGPEAPSPATSGVFMDLGC